MLPSQKAKIQSHPESCSLLRKLERAATHVEAICKVRLCVLTRSTQIFPLVQLYFLKYLIDIYAYQGGRTWQPFVGGKNSHENFRQVRIYNFCDKCVFFARNRKFANLIQLNYAIYTM